ncbi:hypothetical protein BRC97_01085 [Halobacteriales archaeon QS_6_71_20]|nr:MAG: hypothetical protein BRC97_01085 [Halobacteriales archaeon QS_6_71_20]
MPKLDPGRADRTAAAGEPNSEEPRSRPGGGTPADATDRRDRAVPFGGVAAPVVAAGVVIAVVGRTVAVGVAGAVAALDTATLRALGLLDDIESLVAAGDAAAMAGGTLAGVGVLYGLLRGALAAYRRGA